MIAIIGTLHYRPRMALESLPYQSFLRDAYTDRSERNSAYSLRAFARDLGLSVASISRVMAGKQGLSSKAALRIAKRLELGTAEGALFCSLVESQHARAKTRREEARSSLRSPAHPVTELSLEYFRTISDWHHFAIMELTGVDAFRPDPKWIAKRLKIPVLKVRAAISRLLELELIEMTLDGSFKKTADFRATPSGIPSRALKQRHQQILRKAETAILEQPVSEREFSSVTLSLHTDDLDWAREEMKKFRRELATRLTSRSDKNRLYEFSMQLFALDQPKKEDV